jgi:uncharacterized protein
MSATRLEIRESINQIDPTQWENLAGTQGYSSHGWLSAVERFPNDPVDPKYLLVFRDGYLIAAMIAEIVRNPDRQNGVTRVLLGRGRWGLNILHSCFLPALAVGVPYGYGGHVLLAPNLAPAMRAELVRILVAGIDALGQSLGLPVWYLNVLSENSELCGALEASGYLHARHLPLAVLDVRWESFDDYLGELRRRSRKLVKDIRRESNRCRDAGVRLVEIEDPKAVSSLDSRLINLASQTWKRHGEDRFPFRPGFFSSLGTGMGGSLLVCTATRANELVGFASMVTEGDTAWAESLGLDYDAAGNDFTYFNLVFHWPIEAAIARGLKRIVFGRGQYALKMRRGCVLSDTLIFHKPGSSLLHGPYRVGLRMLESYYQRQVPRGASRNLCLEKGTGFAEGFPFTPHLPAADRAAPGDLDSAQMIVDIKTLEEHEISCMKTR